MPSFLIETFYGSLLTVDEGNDYIAVFGVIGAADYNYVAVKDTCVYHTLSAYPQRKELCRINALGLKADEREDRSEDLHVAGDVHVLRNVGQDGRRNERAVALAGDRALLGVLHQNLRTMMMQSPLMDTRRYIAELEQAYRNMLDTKESGIAEKGAGKYGADDTGN